MADEKDITSKHPEYVAKIEAWHTMRDTVLGADAVKLAGSRYLPMKSGIRAIKDKIKQDEAHSAYMLRAEFPDIVAPTIRGTMGLVHSKDSVIELPTALESMREKATKDGLTLQQLHRKITVELFRTGRFALLPGILDSQFHLAGYVAETLINWDSVDGILSYSVLNESANVRDKETNKWGLEEKYRELYLDDLGQFVSRMWIEVTDSASAGKKTFLPLEEEFSTIRGQARLDFIPLVVIGPQDLTVMPDEIPLYGLAKLALRSYRLDADYVTALHMTSEPTAYVTGVSKDAAPSTIGASALWILEDPTAKAGFLEFSGPGVAAQQKAIQDTQERAIMFGAQLFSDNKRAAESGEAIRLRIGSQTSSMKMISVSSAAGLEQALKFVAIWAGADPKLVSVEPNLEFVDQEISPQEITALVSAWQAQAYSKSTLFDNLQRGGVIDPEKIFDEEEELIELEEPGLGAPTDELDDDDPGGASAPSLIESMRRGFGNVFGGGNG